MLKILGFPESTNPKIMIFVTNGFAMRATDVKIPAFCTEFRAASNGTCPGPQNPFFFVGWGVGVLVFLLFVKAGFVFFDARTKNARRKNK